MFFGCCSSCRWPFVHNAHTIWCAVRCADVVKCDEKIDEVKIKTADVSSKFKFFETYTPTKTERKPFRITPPREGTAKVEDSAAADPPTDEPPTGENGHEYTDASVKAAQRSNTTSLKSFTPPPDDSRHLAGRNSESGSEYTDSDGDDDTDDSDDQHERRVVDQALQEAQAAARAKQLRAKFEKWEQKEIRREQEHLRLYDGEDQSQVENTKRYADAANYVCLCGREATFSDWLKMWQPEFH